MRSPVLSLALLLVMPLAVRAQAPHTVFFEDLTFNEIRDLIQGGYRNVILPTGGTEDKGPHMVMGEHNIVVSYASEQIARTLGNTLVAPVIAYVPEGTWDPPSGHMRRAGTMTMPDDEGYTELLENAANSLKASGFRNIIFLGDSGGNQNGMRTVAEKLNSEWAGSGVRVLYIPDFYSKSHQDQEHYITENLGVPPDEIGGHANLMDTSELMFVDPTMVRVDKIEPGNDENGVSGDPTNSSPQLGEIFIQIKVDNAVSQIRQLMSQGRNR